MRLTVADRLELPAVLPIKGDYITLTIREDIMNKLKVGQAESLELGLRIEDGSFRWDAEKAKEMDIEWTKAEFELIKQELKKIDERKELDVSTFRFYRMFMDSQETIPEGPNVN